MSREKSSKLKYDKEEEFATMTTEAAFQPVLHLVEEVIPLAKDEKAKYISIDLKLKAGGPASTPTYEKHVRVVDGGTPQAYIAFRRDLEEVFRQNKVDIPADQKSIILAILKNETRTVFEVALEEAQGIEDRPSEEHVAAALSAVAETIFPHRALEMQKEWMQRSMRKPFDLSARRTAAAIVRINNALPLFPAGTLNDKFPEEKIVALLEFSLPISWRNKFNLDNYVPTKDNLARLIAECEALEKQSGK